MPTPDHVNAAMAAANPSGTSASHDALSAGASSAGASCTRAASTGVASLGAPPINPATLAAITNLLADYAHGLDDAEVDAWSSFFTPDGSYQITTRENVAAGYPIGIMLCEGRGMMDDRVKALNTANIFEAHTHCHVCGHPRIEADANGGYTARSNFSIYRTMYTGEAELFATGKYLDRIVIVEGRPYFRERRVVLDSRRIDTLLVYPL